MLHATLFIMPPACQGTPVCLQVLLLAFLEQGLTSITASAVQLITTTPASQGYMMSQGMVSLQHTATSACAQRHTMCPSSGCAQARPADQLQASSCRLSGLLPKLGQECRVASGDFEHVTHDAVCGSRDGVSGPPNKLVPMWSLMPSLCCSKYTCT